MTPDFRHLNLPNLVRVALSGVCWAIEMSEVQFFAFHIISRNRGNFYVVVDVCLWVQRLHPQIQVLLRLRLPLLLLLVMVVLLGVPLLFILLFRNITSVCTSMPRVRCCCCCCCCCGFCWCPEQRIHARTKSVFTQHHRKYCCRQRDRASMPLTLYRPQPIYNVGGSGGSAVVD